MTIRSRRLFISALVLAGLVFAGGCDRGRGQVKPGEIKIGVLLVAHGSKSATWVGMVKKLAEEVKGAVLKEPGVKDMRLAFLEETKPSIAAELKAFDAEGFNEVIVIPVFISSESSRLNDYVQFLAGVHTEASHLKQLEKEGYEIYYPHARITVTPAMSDSEVLKKNVLRRVLELRGKDSGEDMGVLLVGYGDQAYAQQMQAVMEGIGRYLKIKTDVGTVGYAFCGKLTDYSGTPVVEAINDLLKIEKQVLVVPVLLGVDEMLQVNAIQGGINAVETSSRVRFKPDAVLPDKVVNDWVVERAHEAAERINQAGSKITPALPVKPPE